MKVSVWVWVLAGLGGLSVFAASGVTPIDIVLNAGIWFLIGFVIDRFFRKRKLSRSQNDQTRRVEASTQPTDAFCGSCGVALAPAVQFCGSCGNPVSS